MICFSIIEILPLKKMFITKIKKIQKVIIETASDNQIKKVFKTVASGNNSSLKKLAAPVLGSTIII